MYLYVCKEEHLEECMLTNSLAMLAEYITLIFIFFYIYVFSLTWIYSYCVIFLKEFLEKVKEWKNTSETK